MVRIFKIKDSLNCALTLTLSVFLAFGIYNKRITKYCFVISVFLFLLIGFSLFSSFSWRKIFLCVFKYKFIFLFLSLALLSTVFSYDLDTSIEVFGERYLPYFLFFFMGVYLGRYEKNRRFLIRALIFGATILSLGAVLDILKAQRFIRIFTSFGIHCIFGAYFFYTIPFFYAEILERSSRTKLFILIPSFILLFIVFLFHYSRACWIALVSAYIVSSSFFKKIRRFTYFFVILFIILVLLLPVFRERLFSFYTLRPETWGDRVTMWKASLQIFKRYPVLGSGPGTYKELMYKVVDEKQYKEGRIHKHTHNTYLEVLAETGLLGFLTFMSIFINFFIKFFQNKFNRLNSYQIAFFITILSTLIGELTTSNILVGVTSAGIFWFIFGLIYSK